MQKLLTGIREFRKTARPQYRETFARLALGQSPDCLFFACADSRVVPNMFVSTQPGDLFVVRNVGNIVPPCGPDGRSRTDRSEGAAVEFSLMVLGVRDIVVCGHSECGAMRAILSESPMEKAPNLREWLEEGRGVVSALSSDFGKGLSEHNRLSQLNVLQQLENLRSYPVVREQEAAGKIALHGWWFDLAEAEVLTYRPEEGMFVVVGEERESST